MGEEIRAQLCAAVGTRSEVRFSYGVDKRVVCPHAVYETEDGDILVAGPTAPLGKWHRFVVASIEKLELTGHRFDPDKKFTASGAEYHRVFCSV
jgi:hypothetical protein